MRKFVLSLLLGVSLFAQAKSLAITFDDLPFNRDIEVKELSKRTDRLLQTLNRYQVPTTGFVNEKHVAGSHKKKWQQILARWLDAKTELGNHTYSHVSLHRVGLSEFEAEVVKGEKVTKALRKEKGLHPRYFRHPYLHEGLTANDRHALTDFLNQHGYQVAPVTIDTDDWQFDNVYRQALEVGDRQAMQAVKAAYLRHTRKKFAFYDQVTNTMFGRDIKQIWLLHADTINSDCLPDLLDIAKANGYDFISLDNALRDQAYQHPNAYFNDFGVSW